MTLDQLDDFMRRAGDVIDGCRTCRHGHIACSDREGGRCSDEAWQRKCSDEPDEDYQERMAE